MTKIMLFGFTEKKMGSLLFHPHACLAHETPRSSVYDRTMNCAVMLLGISAMLSQFTCNVNTKRKFPLGVFASSDCIVSV